MGTYVGHLEYVRLYALFVARNLVGCPYKGKIYEIECHLLDVKYGICDANCHNKQGVTTKKKQLIISS